MVGEILRWSHSSWKGHKLFHLWCESSVELVHHLHTRFFSWNWLKDLLIQENPTRKSSWNPLSSVLIWHQFSRFSSAKGHSQGGLYHKLKIFLCSLSLPFTPQVISEALWAHVPAVIQFYGGRIFIQSYVEPVIWFKHTNIKEKRTN